MSLSASGLSVREHCAVITFKDRFNERESTFIINILLFRVLSIYDIEDKRSGNPLRLSGFV
jgi:hypothetical protein